MNQSEHSQFSVEKPSQTLSGPYTSPPPIGYPTRDVVVVDLPAAAVETKSKGDDDGCCTRFWGCLGYTLGCFACGCLSQPMPST